MTGGAWKLMSDGGPVMWPIAALSVAGLGVAIGRYFALKSFLKTGKRKCGGAQEELDRLQWGFGFVSTVITAEPMLGILGTVTGIIKTFGSFRGAEGASPIEATAGIGEALLTTAAGIVAALVLLFPYNCITGLLAKAAAKLEAEGEGGAGA